jgi:hypothetical protein
VPACACACACAQPYNKARVVFMAVAYSAALSRLYTSPEWVS